MMSGIIMVPHKKEEEEEDNATHHGNIVSKATVANVAKHGISNGKTSERMSIGRMTRRASLGRASMAQLKLFVYNYKPFYFIEYCKDSLNNSECPRGITRYPTRQTEVKTNVPHYGTSEGSGQYCHQEPIVMQNGDEVMVPNGSKRSSVDYEISRLSSDLKDLRSRYDQALREVDYYRKQHNSVIKHNESMKKEVQSLKLDRSDLQGKLNQSIKEYQNLKLHHDEHYKELSELRRQDRKVIHSGSSEVLNKMYDTALDRWESLKKEHEALRKLHADLITDFNYSKSILEQKNEDCSQLQKQNETILSEREYIQKQLNHAKHQFTSARRELDAEILRRQKLEQDLRSRIQERDHYSKSYQDAKKSLLKVTQERDAAVSEHKLVMKERDTVHREINSLHEQVEQSEKKLKDQELEIKQVKHSNEQLGRKLQVLKDEKLKFETNCLQMNSILASIEQDRAKVQEECDKFSQERDIAQHERIQAITDYEAMQQQCYNAVQQKQNMRSEFDMASQELGALRKRIEMLEGEGNDLQKDVTNKSKQRDFAFSEWEKTVKERDSIKAMCDKLRKERDLAVADYAEALRASDVMKRQLSSATKELKETKAKIISGEHERRMKQSVTHSRDSAIDADFQEWETETIEFEFETEEECDASVLGFDFGDRKSNGHVTDDCSTIFISKVDKGSRADGRLRVNDYIMKVNNINMTNVNDRNTAIEALKKCRGIVNIVVKRRRCSSSKMVHSVKLYLAGEDHGLSLESGVYIRRISPGSIAAKEGSLSVGDRIISINGIQLENRTTRDVEKMLQMSGDPILIGILRSSSSSSFSTSTSPTFDSIKSQESTSSKSSLAPFPEVHEKIERREASNTECKNTTLERTKKDIYHATPIQITSQTDEHFSIHHGPIHDRKGRSTSKRSDDPWQLQTMHNAPMHHQERGHEQRGPKENIKHHGSHQRESSHSHQRQNSQDKHSHGYAHPVSQNTPQDSSKHSHEHLIRHKPNDKPRIPTQNPSSRNIHKADWGKFNGSDKDHRPSETIESPRSQRGTWPKSRQPPEELCNPKKPKSNRETIIPIVNQYIFCEPNKKETSRSNGPQRSVRQPNKAPSDKSLPLQSNQHEIWETNPRLVHSMHMASVSLPDTSEDFVNREGTSLPLEVSRSSSIRSAKPNQSAIMQSEVQRLKTSEPQYYNGKQHNSTSKAWTSPTSTANFKFNPGTQPFSSIPATSQIVRHQYVVPSYMAESSPVNRRPGHNDRVKSPLSETMYGGRSMTLPSEHYQSSNNNNRILENITPEMKQYLAQPNAGTLSLPTSFPRPERIQLSSGKHRMSPGPTQSTNSLERTSVKSYSSGDGAMSPSIPENISGRSSLASITESVYTLPRPRPREQEIRTISIEKSSEQLGISISMGFDGGIMVTDVQPGSLAHRAGLVTGDQILEYNGINLRKSTYDLAAKIIWQGGDSVQILAQYNPEKIHSVERRSVCASNQTTPTATPISTTTNSPVSSRPPSAMASDNGTVTPPTPRASMSFSSPIMDDSPMPCEPRFVFLRKLSSSLGISTSGGNASGIFVSELQPDSIANRPDGLRVGDQILEYNGVDLRSATAEQAALEFQKPTDTITILAQYNVAKFNKIQEQPCDSFYIEAQCRYAADNENFLSFKKGTILFVDDTMANGEIGLWHSWIVEENGQKIKHGHILGKTMFEQDLARKRSYSEDEDLRHTTSRRSVGGKRGSFFRRKKHHQRQSSKDSRELNALETQSMSDVPIMDDIFIPTYQRVERLDYNQKRPVLVIGPLNDRVNEKLELESPDKFTRCHPEVMKMSLISIEKAISDSVFIDYHRNGEEFECVHTSTIKEISKQGCHCLVDICPSAVERLHRLHLYPIVIYIKFKSPKQIKEQRDPRFLPERVHYKQAKELFENAQRQEQNYKHFFSDTIPGGNLASICNAVKKIIDREQNKTIWVPSSTPL
ncbi:disks large homolog 5-like isoform X2 [Anneissia japonica]|uniref:disks large homolog 5-like isoform X2 n=1 Tax=Anneissia japonica TaxID=1529436 RepID=UPI001425B392|nr:disks large homolog 5-like isoform X2 [Anneissia japonica]